MNIPAPIDISSIDTTSTIGKIAGAALGVCLVIGFIAQIVQSAKDDRNEDNGSIAWGLVIFVTLILLIASVVTVIWTTVNDSAAKGRAVNQLIEETTGLTFVNEGDKPDGSSIPFTDEDGATVRYFVTIDNDRVFFDAP